MNFLGSHSKKWLFRCDFSVITHETRLTDNKTHMNSIQVLRKEGKRTVEGSKNTALWETNLQNKMQSEPKEAPQKAQNGYNE